MTNPDNHDRFYPKLFTRIKLEEIKIDINAIKYENILNSLREIISFIFSNLFD